MLIVLAGLAVIVSAAAGPVRGLLNMAVASATAALLDYAVMHLQQRKISLPDGAMLTGMIIGMVLSPTTSWPVVVLAVALAIASKHLLALAQRPIFNPAAVGLLAVLTIFSTGQDWWGGLPDLPVWWLSLLLMAGYWIAHKVHKFPHIFTFLAVYFATFLSAALFGTAEVSDVFRVPFLNTALFLAFFMLTDPPTSPAKPAEQVLNAIVAAGVSVWFNLVVGGLSFLLAGLLAANLTHAFVSATKRRWKRGV
ncbi:RnfABCDGE type electron transport complex subunit D [Paenibacillus cymbidii]|uniref:RnfABCDGE type electron transport complex subunit D n=1 Tax=Paenibacillus cymbidii TaxID=1639034 RepID=UPI001436B76F|nr:RnfABCDGE type electron transport complex subunit D [Paenibacillus cymbidii]